MIFDFDLFVIGGGSGGVRAARVAAEAGARVALAEEDRYGGTCVIRGCVPKKLMVFASEYASMLDDAAEFGWNLAKGGFDWKAFQSKMHAELDRLETIYRGVLKTNGVQSFDTRATLVAPNSVRLSDGRQLTAKTILIATGGFPTLPGIEGDNLAITSNDVFHLEALPKSILIVGGGYIASEFSCIFNRLGSKVTQFYRGQQILRGFDNEARNLVSQEMVASGIDLRLETNILTMAEHSDGIKVTSTNGDIQVFEQVMFATGRSPNAMNLGLEELGIETGPSGEIIVDQHSRTNIPSVYAVGDVTNRVNLTPVAIREGAAFVETAIKNTPTSPDHELIPTAIFTQPEMGTVGLSEEEARSQEDIEVYATKFRPMRSAFAGRSNQVLMKLVVSRATQKVLGCHIVTSGAGELIQLAGIAVKMGATKEDFDRVVAVHPTMAEELVTMKEPTRSVPKR